VWALLRGPHLAGSFRDLDAELADVLPAAALRLELLRAHCRRRAAAQYHDPDEAALRDRLLASLYQFELEHTPDPAPLKLFLSSIVISDAASCQFEIEVECSTPSSPCVPRCHHRQLVPGSQRSRLKMKP
jgi:hypothetical protein